MIRIGGLIVLVAILSPGEVQVSEVRDILYYEGKDRDDRKHRLDLYLPKSEKPVPVLMFIHGGAWRLGDRWQYMLIGRRMAERGIACAVISYRLSPGVKHPEHIRDCARAFAWLYNNIGKHGGDRDRMFVAGHSAGGHLTALLALDPQWLAAEGLPPDAIRAAIPISGVLEVPDPGKESRATRDMFLKAFGDDAGVRRAANPLNHLKEGKVPLLIITETLDPGIMRPMMNSFRKQACRDGRTDIEYVDVVRDHLSVIGLMMRRCDPVQDRVVEFIRKHAETK